jgi:hypothetical protein
VVHRVGRSYSLAWADVRLGHPSPVDFFDRSFPDSDSRVVSFCSASAPVAGGQLAIQRSLMPHSASLSASLGCTWSKMRRVSSCCAAAVILI